MEGVVALVVLGSFCVCLRVTWRLAWRAAYAQGLEDGQQRGYIKGLDTKIKEIRAQDEAVPAGVPLRVYAQAAYEASRAGFAGVIRSRLIFQRIQWARRDVSER